MKRVVLREIDRIAHTPLLVALTTLLPIASLLVMWGIFSAAVPRELPVAVVDPDSTSLSRRLVRMIDANPTLRVVSTSTPEAEEMILAGQVYGTVTVPRDFARDLLRGRTTYVVAHYNAQLLVVGSLVRRALSSTVSTFSAGVELRQRRGRGASGAAAAEQFEPIRAEIHTLANPELSYVSFLLPSLFVTLLQLFCVTTSVWAFGDELRRGTAGEWLAAADDSTLRALAGKFLVYAAWFGVLGLGAVVTLYGLLQIPFEGSRLTLVLASLLFTTASVAVGMLFVAGTSNLRFACSVTAFYTGPAFAFSGITFPVHGMPPLAQWWSALLPMTHVLDAWRLLANDAGGHGAARGLFVLAAFTVVALPLSWSRLRSQLRSSKYWGRL